MRKPKTLSPRNMLRRRKWINPDGVLHRVDGPAIEWEAGAKEWYVDGERVRIEGVAVWLP